MKTVTVAVSCSGRVISAILGIAAFVVALGWTIENTSLIIATWKALLLDLTLDGQSIWFAIGWALSAMALFAWGFCINCNLQKLPSWGTLANVVGCIVCGTVWFLFNRAAESTFESFDDISAYAAICMFLLRIPFIIIGLFVVYEGLNTLQALDG